MVEPGSLTVGQYKSDEAVVFYSNDGRQKQAGKVRRNSAQGEPVYFIVSMYIIENPGLGQTLAAQTLKRIDGNFNSQELAMTAFAQRFDPAVLDMPGGR